MSYLPSVYRVSLRHAWRVARLANSTFRYQSIREPPTALRLRIREIAQVRVRYGYRKIRVLLKREGWQVGNKLVYRLYCEEGLRCATNLGVGDARRGILESGSKPSAPNQAWSLDFVADHLADGRRFRALTIVDVFTRESLAIEVGQSLKGEDVARVLSRISSQRASPKMLFCDNGSEFTSQAMDFMGVSCRSASRFFATGQAHGQRVRRIVQRDVASRVSGRTLVHNASRSKADHRGVKTGIQ